MATFHMLQKQREISSVLGQTRGFGIGNLLFAAPSPKVDPQGEVTNLPVAFSPRNQLIKNLIDRSVTLS
jgi:hypothetical protein